MSTEPKMIVKGRSAARLAAIQALYQLEQEPSSAHKVVQEFITHRFGEIIDGTRFINPDKTLFQDIVIGVTEGQEALDAMISGTLTEGWRLDRLETVVRAILRAGVFELSRDSSVPSPVVINEYVDITKAFCSGQEPSFVNASLDALATLLRTQDFQE